MVLQLSKPPFFTYFYSMRLVFVLMCFLSHLTYAQRVFDSLKLEWEGAGLSSSEFLDSLNARIDKWHDNPEDVYQMGDEYIRLAKESKNSYHIAWSNFQMAMINMRQTNYDEGREFGNSSLDWAYSNLDTRLC